MSKQIKCPRCRRVMDRRESRGDTRADDRFWFSCPICQLDSAPCRTVAAAEKAAEYFVESMGRDNESPLRERFEVKI